MLKRRVFITGGTGYVGRALVEKLLGRGHEVRALVRRGSEGKLAAGAEAVTGDPLDESSFAGRVAPSDTFVQLVGVAHPSPAKAKEFREIDLVSGRASVGAARAAGVRHFVYVSVAQPAPVMRDYQAVRAEVEAILRESGLPATILRPWYVLGPGHRWPYALIPFYWVMERLPSKRETALRLGLVTREQMIAALVRAVEEPSNDFRVVNVPEIKAMNAAR
ncbi:MAG TPA: NAD(P)H-binding protein [Pyrinomonadaceae bacterium]|nr:NAD(P)H-binding protein [Pyrinomonadaceae bacterium]